MFIEELKALYAKYRPEDAGAMHGETEAASLCQCFDTNSPHAVIRPTDSTETKEGKTPLRN